MTNSRRYSAVKHKIRYKIIERWRVCYGYHYSPISLFSVNSRGRDSNHFSYTSKAKLTYQTTPSDAVGFPSSIIRPKMRRADQKCKVRLMCLWSCQLCDRARELWRLSCLRPNDGRLILPARSTVEGAAGELGILGRVSSIYGGGGVDGDWEGALITRMRIVILTLLYIIVLF